MTTRVRWEGVDDSGKTGADSAAKHGRKRSSIDFICTTIRHLSHHHHHHTSALKTTNVKLDGAMAVRKLDMTNVDIKNIETNRSNEASNSRENRENVDIAPVGDGQLKAEQEALLPNTQEKQQVLEDGNKRFPTGINSVSHYTAGSNDRVSLPRSGQNTPMHQRNNPDKVVKLWKQHGKQATVDMLSALYGIMLVVMGVAFPTSQVISSKIPSHYYEGFYAYLYFVALGFFGYIYILLKAQFKISPRDWARRWSQWSVRLRERRVAEKEIEGDSVFRENGPTMDDIVTNRLRMTLGKELDPRHSPNHGSFYLRMGAVVFGVGSMIYSGLEFAQYFEMSSNPLCDDIMMAVQPASRLLFTFFQMYFVFLNAKIQIIRNSNVIVARFGMMHIVATNLCIWLNVIIQETKHEILSFQQEGDHGSHSHHQMPAGHFDDHAQITDESGHFSSNGVGHWLNETAASAAAQVLDSHSSNPHQMVRRTLSDECHRSDLMGTLTQNASPFLFPCAIEYSLICAAIMYEIWKHTGEQEGHRHQTRSINGTPTGSRTPRTSSSVNIHSQRRSPHHYSVDCTNANKGLFFGIFVLVLSILSMILFFVLINRDDYKSIAITIIHLSELALYILTLIAVLIGIIQVSQLQFDASHPLDLDNILLIVALTGVIAYNVFTIVGTQFSDHDDRMLVLINALTAVMQAVAQTVLVLGASKRHLYTRRQEQRKPGREIITFLMVTNFAMWAVITLEKSRFDAHPVQSQFFGQWPWTIITNISSPLAIFYRYHSTVCLCEIWKRCYKVSERVHHVPVQHASI